MSRFDQASTILRSTMHPRHQQQPETLEDQGYPGPRYDVASLISHGVRTPLASILGFREILQDAADLPESEWSDFHRVIASDGHRLTRFVLTLRDYMELCEGRLMLDRTMSDLGTTVRQAIEACSDDARSRGVRLLNAVSPEPLTAVADHVRLRTAIEQMIANAVQATQEGGRVVVQLYRTSGPAIISVADTGIGIPSPDVEKVTDAFYRIDRRDGGESRLGLGLTFARALAEMHDGSLAISSREGVGSMVVMRIPQPEVP